MTRKFLFFEWKSTRIRENLDNESDPFGEEAQRERTQNERRNKKDCLYC